MQGDQVSESVLDATDEGQAPPLWSPAGIALWSVLFTPAFGAWLQMYNYRRLGDHAGAAVAWRWCVAGLLVLAWNAMASAIGQRLGLGSPLFDWLNGAMLLAWLGATGPAHVQAVKARWGNGYARRAWDSVVVLGLLAAMAYLAASGMLRLVLVELT